MTFIILVLFMVLIPKFLQIVLRLLPLILMFLKRSGTITMHLINTLLIVFLLENIEVCTASRALPEHYIEKVPFPTKVKEHSIITSVVSKSNKESYRT